MRGSGRFLSPERAQRLERQVSIPFIAGQWSLREGYHYALLHAWTSQSPSLRGSGRFRRAGAPRAPAQRRVSIPFIAGQWSLRVHLTGAPVERLVSQSPSLRGSGRFPCASASCRARASGLNPLHCGAVVASDKDIADQLRKKLEVSIPFIAGQWSLPASCRARASASARCLNPLHCGAVVASR